MRLLRLRLLNFRQHADTEIEFRPGLTGIVGPNGAGKSTILEAIGWALYGSGAARGTADTIRFARAPGRSRVEVELVLELAGHRYRVVRTLHGAEVYLDEGATPVATTLSGVTEYLEERIGMTREEFYNTYFTGQKELVFLAQMGPAQRGRFLSQVLGYERLRGAQERARARRNELRHQVEGLRAGLPDPDSLRVEREVAEQRRKEALRAVREAERAREGAEARRAELEPRWEEAQRARERGRELAHQADLAGRELESARREEARADAELARLAAAEAELAALRLELAALPDVVEECRQLAELARLAERRRALEDSAKALETELAGMAERQARLEQAPGLFEQYGRELEEAKRALDEADRKLESLREEWVQRRQEAETRLQAYRDRAQELKDHIQELRQAGPEGVCPTCERPLREEFDKVVGRLEEEWEELVQDGKWLRQRLEQLKAKPGELTVAEARRAELQRAIEEKSERRARCERAMQELDALREDRARKEERLERLRAELAGLPPEYDAERHRRAEERLAELRKLESRAAALEQLVEARPAQEREKREASERAAAAGARLAELERASAALAFSEEQFAEIRSEYEAAADAVRQAELRLTEVRGLVHAAEEALEKAVRDEAAYRERRAALAALELELRHHNELDAAFGELRAELNSRVRPELSELASVFLAEVTDARYTALEIDENYNVLVLDEGEEKPVISGGEEDIVNLVLRVAISQMIAERAGHPLSLLILDEVFGSLDVERRDAVLELLHRLEGRFEQVILITHIETVREGLDQIIRVAYDERTGASVVWEERPGEAVIEEEEILP